MDTESFFPKILSDEGLIVLAEFRNSSFRKHHFLPNFEAAAAKVKQLDSTGAEVYHGCATYQTDENRKQDNVARVKCLWLDIDVGPNKDYANRKEAIDALGDLCRKVGLHLPMIVSSGRGLHCYWTFDAAVSGDVWKACAQLFRQTLDAVGFKHDPSRTTDQASILRPVGATWRKDGERPVELKRDTESKPFGWYQQKFSQYLGVGAAPVISALGNLKKYTSIFPIEKLGGKAEYAPSSAIKIASQCKQLGNMQAFRGAVSEPEWRNAIGVIKHSIEGDDLCHEWSMGDPRYDFDETQAKIDRWETGPTTCATFERIAPHLCNGCQFKGKVTSPIQLGYVAETIEPPKLEQPEHIDKEVIDYEKLFPKGWDWNTAERRLKRLVKDKDGLDTWMPVADTLFYPTTRIRLEDGTWAQRIRMEVAPGRWREFEMPSKLISNQEMLRSHLAAHEILISPRMGQHVGDYVGCWLEEYKRLGIETQQFKEFGWHQDGTAFLIGDNLITAKAENKVIMSEKISQNLRKLSGEGSAGDANEWGRIFNYIYDRPGAEPYQFTAMGLLSSPIVGILNLSDWHGIPIALTGAGGQGKTAVGLAACSAYGNPTPFVLAGANATFNAIDPHIGTLKHLPVVFDEVTGREADAVSKKLYGLSAGESRDRADVTGRASEVKYYWKTIPLITGNTNITDMLARLDVNQAEASQMRVFEYPMPSGTLEKVFPGVDAQTLINDELGTKHYGVAGRMAIREMMHQRQAIIADFMKYRKIFGQKSNTYDPKERFYVDLIATAYVGAHVFQKLGLLTFNLDNAKDWALSQMLELREARADNIFSAEDKLSQFLLSLQGHILATKRTDGPNEPPSEAFPLRGEIRARLATTAKSFIVTVSAFDDWCLERNIQPNQLRKELANEGFIIPFAERFQITRATSLPSTRQRVIAFNYDKLFATEAGKEMAKVVNIKDR
jgi:hypothetical protein